MKHSKEVKWLYQQIPFLIKQGVLNEETADQIKNHYGPVEDTPSYNLAFIIAAVLGTLLIGAGIILIFAYNWENFSRPVRTFLSFLPLIVAQLIYAFAFFKKRESVAWMEASSLFLMLMLAACIALISQTYHIQGEMEDFLLTWSLLSIPLLYLMNSNLCAILYMIVIAAFAVNMRGSESVYYWGLLLAVVPHFYFNFKKENTTSIQLLGWTTVITLGIAFWFVVEAEIFSRTLIWAAVLLSTFYFAGNEIYRVEGLLKKPFQNFSIGAIFVFTMFLAATWDPGEPISWEQFISGDKFSTWAANINFFVFVISILAFLFILFRQFRKGFDNYFLLVFPFLAMIDVLLRSNEKAYVAAVLANIFLFAFGIFYINKGIHSRSMSQVNLGMLFVVSIIIARFFDTDWSTVVKGVIFVLLGVGFLSVNVFLSKKLKKESE